VTSLPPPTATNATHAAHAKGATKIYGTGDSEVRALDDVDVAFQRGKFTAIMGPSGSGKSTLMHCIAGLDSLTSGSVSIGDTDLSKLSDKALTQLRRDKVGFIFQAFNLIPTLTAYENIVLPLTLGKKKGDETWINRVIDTISLRDRLEHRPSELPAASNSALQSPVRSPANPTSSSPTSQRATSTQRPAPKCSRSCAALLPTSAKPS